MFDFERRLTNEVLEELANLLMGLSNPIGFKVSSRGWCYLMEQAGYINKSQFDKVDGAINKARKEGILPVDFVAEEDARSFSCLETPSKETMNQLLKRMLNDVKEGHYYFTPNWWEGEEYYIQVLVEKIDLKTLFEPICRDYHIPIANAKGWSSILQRAEYARRFKKADFNGMQPILLYCGDHDPDGLRISDTIRQNLRQVSEIKWNDGWVGYDPENLIIKRFGLNYDFIVENGYTWIDNLITGSGKNLNDPAHKNYNYPYVRQYIDNYGARKCEANAIVTTPNEGRQLFVDELESWLGDDSLHRFEEKRQAIEDSYNELLETTGLLEPINEFLGE